MELSAIILTLNEEIHIRRCLTSIRQYCSRIYVVDCFSTDRTVEIARELGSTVVQHKWPGSQGEQFNWALEHLPIDTEWILRLDADEYLFPETIAELRQMLPGMPRDVTSISMPLVRIWMGKKIRFGTSGIVLRRMFRKGAGKSDTRLMDECIVTEYGKDYTMKGAFADDNLNHISWWTVKHLNYAIREAATMLNNQYHLSERTQDENRCVNQSSASKRHKKGLYARLPLFLRALIYFFYRYFLCLGFLDGKEGFCWHFFQGLWYRMMVDAKIFEIRKACGNDPQKIQSYIQEHYKIII